MRRISWHLMLASCALLVESKRANAAACCGTGYGIGQRVAKAETAAIVGTIRDAEGFGSFDDDANYSPNAAGHQSREVRLDLSGVVRIYRGLQLGAAVPLVATWNDGHCGGGVGDATVFGRYDFIAPGGSGGWPGIALTFATTAPTGKPVASSTDPYAADVTGLGVWEFRPGIAIEKVWWTGYSLVAGVSVGFRTSHTDSGTTVQLAPKASGILAVGYSWTWGLGIAGGAIFELEGAPDQHNPTFAVPSQHGRTRLAAVAIPTYEIDHHWSLVGSIEVDLPISGIGRNNLANAALSLGVRRVFPIYD